MVNMNIVELIDGITGNNFIDTVKVLKIKYGISYMAIAEASKINRNTLAGIIMSGYATESVAEMGAESLRRFYLGESR